jgi:ABC-type nickel/cobalt efflux system permease component RcnA
MSRAWRLRLAGLALAVSAAVLVPMAASAHPLGNFTVNQFSGITVRNDGVDVAYILDMAEIPTAQLLAQLASDETALLSPPAAESYRRSECDSLRSGLILHIGAGAPALALTASSLSFPAGAAGLHTLRLTCRFTATAPTVSTSVTYANHNFDGRVGWREVTAVGSSARLAASDVPDASPSAQLTAYPADLLTSPLDVRSAAMTVVAGAGGGAGAGAGVPAGPAGILPRGVDQFTTAFVSLIARQDVDVAFVALALGLALILGGVHAFAPGHGKTLMAAYLVGQRGSLRHAAALAGSVTVTHTIGVLALGIALSVSTAFAPTQVYPLLGLASGLIVVGIGVSLLVRAWRARSARTGSPPVGHEHSAALGHPGTPGHSDGHVHHHHGGRSHSHDPPVPGAPKLRGVLAIGFAGGLVPSPSALVVLIGGIALHRTWFAVLLVVAYGVGMGLVLTGTGVALRHARTLIDRRIAARRSTRGAPLLARLAGVVPVLTAAVVVTVGLGLTLRGAASL